MRKVQGLGTLALMALMALMAAAGWVLLAPGTVPSAAAAVPQTAQAARPADDAAGRGFSVLAWPQPADDVPAAAPVPARPAAMANAAGAADTAAAAPYPQDEATDPMAQDIEDDAPPPRP